MAHETENDAVHLTYEEAVSRLPEGDHIHSFSNPGVNFLVGMDWPRPKMLQMLRDGDPQESGPAATAMNHGIVIVYLGKHLFVETKKYKV